MNNFSYGYYNNSMHNKYYDKGNVLLLNQPEQIYFLKIMLFLDRTWI